MGLRALAAALAMALVAAAPALATPVVIAVKSAEVAFDSVTRQPVLNLALTNESAKVFATLTSENVGKVLELSIDGEVVSAPVVREPIVGGFVQISGDFDEKTLSGIASRIASGKAVVAVEVRPE